ncbi:MAG: ATP-dependent helicase [Acidimicrobiales bacterium]
MFEVASTPRWARGLNDAQMAAVAHDGPALLVVAGAGTGKTGTLAARVARLIDDGVPPNRILLLTFTRRAAQEMLARAGKLTDGAATAQVWGGTFHSVANRLLRTYGRGAGLDPNFTVLDQGDAMEMFGIVRAAVVETAGPRFPKKETIAAVYDQVVGTQRPLGDVVRAEFPWVTGHLEALPPIFEEYTRRKRSRRVLDYADLLLFWRGMLASQEIGAEVAARFDHVLVDEFQDTDPVQADIVHMMGDRGVSVTVVGDDAQSIYGFRAATVENMWKFGDRRPGTVQVTLEDNYRSIGPILDVANSVLAQSDRHFDKHLRPRRSGTRRPTLVTCHDELGQARVVADAILALREEGMPLSDQSVLFRTGYHSDILELELGRRDIPYVKWGGLKFLEAAHVKDLVSLLRVLDNPWDELAWNRVLRTLPAVGPATVRSMMEALALADIDVAPAVGDVASGPARTPLDRFLHDELKVPSAAREEIDTLRAAFADCLGHAGEEPPVAVQVERLTAWCEPSFDRRYERADVRAGDLQQLQISAESYTSRSRFLTELTLEPPASTGDLADEPHRDDDALTLSTVHSAKGMEWGAVHIIHAADGNFPADMSLSTSEGLEEERRLMYVALTRARDVLSVYVPLRYHHKRAGVGDRHSYAPISRFLAPVRSLFDEVSDGSGTDGHDGAYEGETIDLTAKVSVADEVDTITSGLWTV